MRNRIAWTLMSMLAITLFVGAAQAEESASQLTFQNELQVAANSTTVIGTTTGTAAELAQAASEVQTVSTESLGIAAVDAAPSTDSPIATAEEKAADTSLLAKAEADIPVKLDAKVVEKTSETSLRDMLLVFAVLAGFGLIGYLAISKLKYKNKKASQFEMKILAQHHLGPKRSLAVVRVAGESILIGLTDHHVSMIKSLSLLDEELPETEGADFRAGFESIFSRQNAVPAARETQTRDVSVGTAQVSRVDEVSTDGEEFTISKIRDVVTRQIRQMKTLE